MGLGAKGLEYIYEGVFISLMVIFPLSMNSAKCASLHQGAFIQIVNQGGLLSVDLQNVPASEVFKELARRSSYEFILPEGLLGKGISLKFSGIEFDEGIRRILENAGAKNYALVFRPQEAKRKGGPFYQVEVVLLDGDFSGVSEISLERASFRKTTERPSGVSTRPITPSDSFPVAREVSVPQEMRVSRELSVELAPREAESLSKEVPTPVVLSPENEGVPVYRKLESNQMPTKLQKLTAP